MRTNTLKIDFEHGKLIMDRTFSKAASYVGSNEYNILQNARKDYPSFIVEIRSIKRNQNKEAYRGLTYEYMEYYINKYDPVRMQEYLQMRELAQCHSVRYPRIKQWFLKAFPNVERYGMDETVRQEIESKHSMHLIAGNVPDLQHIA